MLATQLHKPYHERYLHKAVSFIVHVKYIIFYYKKKFLSNDTPFRYSYTNSINRLDQLKKKLCPLSQDTLPTLFQPLYVQGKRQHTRKGTHKCYQHFHFNPQRGYPNLRQDTNISGNMGMPGYPILRDTHISGRVSFTDRTGPDPITDHLILRSVLTALSCVAY